MMDSARSVWEHFQKIDEKAYRCNYCGEEYSYPVTLSLKAHLSNEIIATENRTTACDGDVPMEVQQLCVNSFYNRSEMVSYYCVFERFILLSNESMYVHRTVPMNHKK
jgi:hypothetical protein